MTVSTKKAAAAAALIPTVMAVAASAASAAPAPPTKSLTWKSGGAGCNGTLRIENSGGKAVATSSALCTVFAGVGPMAKIKVTLSGPNGSNVGWTNTTVGPFMGGLASGGTATTSVANATTGNYTACTVYTNGAGSGTGSFSGTATGVQACVTGPIK